MASSGGSSTVAHAIRRTLLLWALPRLEEFDAGEWEELQSRARAADFDRVEWGGVLAGVVFVTWLLRFTPEQAVLPLPLFYFVQFVTAVPLLMLAAGPFYLRNMRRGLDREIERRRRGDQPGKGG